MTKLFQIFRISIILLAFSLVFQVSGAETKVILCLGDSLTAGYGLDKSEAYPALLEGQLKRKRINATVINAGVSGDTSAGGVSRCKWLLKRRIDVLILALGANDGLRGQSTKATTRNLQKIIDMTKAKYPDIVIIVAGMQVPPNMGKDYAKSFRKVFPTIAKKNDAILIPFLLKDVAGIRELNQADGVHPTAQGQEIMAKTVWKYLKRALE